MPDPERSSKFAGVKRVVTQSQDLLRNVFVLATYSGFSVLFLFLFHLSVARYLGPEKYSVLGLFGSILLTVILMSGSLYLIITRFITYHHTRYQYEQINYLVSRSLKFSFAAGFLVFLILFISAPQVATFFNIDSIGPIVVFGFAIWLQMLVPIYEGAFKGLENIHAMGRMRLIENASRFVIALILAYLTSAFAVFGEIDVTLMVFALGLGTFVALATSYNAIKDLQRLHTVQPNMSEIWEYAKPAVATTATIGLLLNLDIILVKHYFPPDQAGLYAAASLLAKIPFLASWVFSTVIFPRVTALAVNGHPTQHLLRNSLKWMSVVVIFFTFLSVFFANRLFRFFFGPEYSFGPFIGPYVFAMGLLAVVNVLVVYQLALRRFSLAKIVPWFLLAELILFALFHSSIFQIVTVTVFVTTLLVATTLYVLRNELQLEYLFNE